MGLNRQERRTLERLGLLRPAEMDASLQEWLEDSEKVVRRGEAWEASQRAAAVVYYEMKRNVWWRRWLREAQHWFHRVLPDWWIGEPEARAMREADADG